MPTDLKKHSRNLATEKLIEFEDLLFTTPTSLPQVDTKFIHPVINT
jgi:hypothetical protein